MIRPGRLALVGVAALAAARAAHAGECSHGGSDTSSGSSDSSDSSDSGGSESGSSSSSDASPGVPACVEESDVYGHRVCGDAFGAWATAADLPPLALSVGTFTRRIGPSLGGGGAAGTMAHELGTYRYRLVDPGAGGADLATIVGAALRVTAAVRPHLYVGAESELGGVVADRGYRLEMVAVDGAAPQVTTRQRMYSSGAALAGVRGQLGRVVIGAELATGVRAMELVVDSQLGACAITDHHWVAEPFVEPRLRVELWASPWVGVGGYAGRDVVGGGGQVVGAELSLHLRSFDRGW